MCVFVREICSLSASCFMFSCFGCVSLRLFVLCLCVLCLVNIHVLFSYFTLFCICARVCRLWRAFMGVL